MLSPSPITHQSKHVIHQARFFSLFLSLLPLILVGGVVSRYALNLPYWDDFLVQDHLLLLKSGTGREKLMHLFDQHWEHRIIWTRFVFILFAKINGILNYYGLTLIGFSGLLVVLGVLFMVFRRMAAPLFYFIPVPFLLFTLQSYENLIWAMASVTNFWILAFALIIFYWLAQNTKITRWIALGLGVMATFASGNGSLVLISGLFVLTYQRHWRSLGIWAFLTVLSVVGYFFTYQRISFFPSPFRYPITDWIKAFFVFLGSFVDPFPNAGNSPLGTDVTIGLSVAVGILVSIIVGISLVSVFRSFRTGSVNRLNSFFLGCFLFLCATAAITVYSRIGFAGPGYLLQSRYRVYSALAISVVYLYSLYHWRNKTFLLRYVAIVILISLSQSLFSDYLCLEGIINQHRRVVSEYFNYLANTPADRQQVTREVFAPTESPFFSRHISQLSALTWWSAPKKAAVDKVDEQPFMYNIFKADAVNPTLDQPDAGSYIFFKSQSHTYLFAAQPLRPSTEILSGFANYFTPHGFYAHILKEKLEPGRYRIGILTNQHTNIHLVMTDRYVTFTSL